MLRTLLALGAISVLLGFLSWRFPYAANTSVDKASIVYYVVLLAVIGGGLAHVRRQQIPSLLRNTILWIAIGLTLVLGYSYRNALTHNRVVAELLPYRIQVSDDGLLSIRASDYGHFFMEADVNGKPVKFMVDTGASDVVLSPRDAARLGFDIAKLSFDHYYRTANGTVRGASVVLDRIQAGPLLIERMPASVNETEMDDSLLGMSFLKKFRSFQITDDTLNLQP